jgi:hypothetical protein
MKRIFARILFFLLISTFGFSAKSLTGIGIYGNLIGSGTGFGSALGLTLKFGNFPVLGLEWVFGDRGTIGVSCDWWVVNDHLAGALNYYLGLGGFLSLANLGNNTVLNFGGRIPIGLQIWALKNLEIFGEITPLVGFIPSISLSFSLRIGVRLHF